MVKPMNKETAFAPIILFVYNRPEHTRRTVTSLLKNPEAEMSDLFVFSDAAKDKSAEEAVRQVREYIRQISGFKTLTIYERDSNWGLANSVIDGVSRICNEFGKVVVLEDDLDVSPHFLAYMNAGLYKYEHDEQVMQIAGYMFPIDIQSNEDALFLPLTSSWGWATWQNSWEKFDKTASSFNTIKNNPSLKKQFDLDGRYPYFKMLEAQKKAKVDSWAIRWYLSVFIKNGLVLYPRKSLVENSGFDGSGVNCVASGFDDTPIDATFEVKTFPANSVTSPFFDELIKKLPKPKFSIKAFLSRLIKPFKV